MNRNGNVDLDLATLDRVYQKFSEALRYAQSVADRNRRKDADSPSSPFYLYKIEGSLADLRDDLVRCAVNALAAELCPNVSIDSKNVRDAMDKAKVGFSSGWIRRHVEVTYGKRQREIALAQIREKLKRHLPFIEVEKYKVRAPCAAEEIVKGRNLTLRVSMYDGHYLSIRYQLSPLVDALGKAARIALEEAAPETAMGAILPESLQAAKTPEEFFRLHDAGGPFRALRPFKNGTLLIQFETNDQALKVAAVILI